jgi:hypothetical protein
MNKRRLKRGEKSYKVYVTFYIDSSKYVGFTSKTGKALETYFGSNKPKDKLVDRKEIVFESNSKATAKLFELLLQLSVFDSLENTNVATTFLGSGPSKKRSTQTYLNDMLNVRVRASHIKGLPNFKLTFEDNKFNLNKD